MKNEWLIQWLKKKVTKKLINMSDWNLKKIYQDMKASYFKVQSFQKNSCSEIFLLIGLVISFSLKFIKIFYFLIIQFGGLESVITAICDNYPKSIGRHRSKFVLVLLVFCFAGALPTVTYVSVTFCTLNCWNRKLQVYGLFGFKGRLLYRSFV